MSSSFTHELRDNPRCLIFTIGEDFRFDDHHAESTQVGMRILDQQTEPLPYIGNLANLSSWNFNEMMVAVARITRGEDSIFHHPMISKLIIVTTDEALIAGSKGMNSPMFGNVRTHIVSTLDEALKEAAR